MRDIMSCNFLHPTWHSPINVLPLTVVYFAHFRARKRGQLDKKEKTQEGEMFAPLQHLKSEKEFFILPP